ncbi:hypothetical protein CEXT_34921 [Caerostris extrusa]|uniref:Uncharacterized protein n=1 Tax=Caerostris extrusa TaxID=172846 RepID=A0AAV4MDT5_CAEEX|nr:hypothetical protein CEXT_34921 [Caerostris extrusa]
MQMQKCLGKLGKRSHRSPISDSFRLVGGKKVPLVQDLSSFAVLITILGKDLFSGLPVRILFLKLSLGISLQQQGHFDSKDPYQLVENYRREVYFIHASPILIFKPGITESARMNSGYKQVLSRCDLRSRSLGMG